jgi:hypothetical protein
MLYITGVDLYLLAMYNLTILLDALMDSAIYEYTAVAYNRRFIPVSVFVN